MSDSVAIFADVHGEAKMLERLIVEIKKAAGEDVEIFSLGDLIDRGPDSKGVIDLCIEHNVKGIMGNHELWLRNLVRDRVFDSFALEPVMGGEWTFLSYGIYNHKDKNKAALDLLSVIPDSHRDFLSNLPDYRVVEVDGHKYFLVHAGISNPVARQFRPTKYEDPSGEAMMERIVATKMSDRFIMWPSPPLPSRFRPQHDMFEFEEGTQVLGHKPVNAPLVTKKFIALDTGCGTCSPHTLSAILLPSRRVIQVKTEDNWTD